MYLCEKGKNKFFFQYHRLDDLIGKFSLKFFLRKIFLTVKCYVFFILSIAKNSQMSMFLTKTKNYFGYISLYF